MGLNELADMETSYTFGLKWTPHTKIKVDDDTSRLERIFAALSKHKPADSLAMCSFRISSAAFKLCSLTASFSLQVDRRCQLRLVAVSHATGAAHHARRRRARGRD